MIFFVVILLKPFWGHFRDKLGMHALKHILASFFGGVAFKLVLAVENERMSPEK